MLLLGLHQRGQSRGEVGMGNWDLKMKKAEASLRGFVGASQPNPKRLDL